MNVGLDLGMSQMRSLRRRRERLIGRCCRSTCVVLANSRIRRQVLRFLGAPFAVCQLPKRERRPHSASGPTERDAYDEALVVLGDWSPDIARLFERPLRPLLQDEQSSDETAWRRQAVTALIDALLPAPAESEARCCISMPAVGRKPDRDDERAFLERLIELRGYKPLWLGAATAIVLAELVGNSFTGVGMSLGAGSCAIGLAHQGVEIAEWTVPLGGNWIDEQLALRGEAAVWDPAGNRFPDTEPLRRWKESLSGSLAEPTAARERVLAEIYRELIAKVLAGAGEELSRLPQVGALRQPLPLVCAGGAASIRGFRELLLEGLQMTPLPVRINDVRVVKQWEFTVARGCLIQAELASQQPPAEIRAA